MKSINNPKWLFLVNTLPSILLLLVAYRNWYVVNSQIDAYAKQIWTIGGLALVSLTSLVLIYASYQIKNKKLTSITFSIATFFIYLTGLILYGQYDSILVPLSTPSWMITEHLGLYVCGFIMPTLLYCMLQVVAWSNSINPEKNPFISLVKALTIPISMYLFYMVLIPFWNPFRNEFAEHTFIVIMVCAVVLFLFYLISWIYSSMLNPSTFNKTSITKRVVFGLFLPLIGLCVNNGTLGDFTNQSSAGVFGNFHNSWFYILALVNGFFVCLPSKDSPSYMLARFLGRAAIFPYIIYFTIVFLPALPLSLIAILVLGLGFLMLTPLILIFIQGFDLANDWKYLSKYFNPILLYGLFFLGLSIIPSSITISYLQDKKVITNSLEYAFSQDASQSYNINKSSLESTLQNIKANKRRSNEIIISHQTPILSSFFNWNVLDNMTLSRDKIVKLEQIYLGHDHKSTYDHETTDGFNVKIKNIKSNSEYNHERDEWTSWVDIDLENKSSRRMAEYLTKIVLPIGCYISDYYLYVGDKKEKGILTDKKSAVWVYNQIRGTNRDPGILYYLSGNEVMFKVFPFSGKEVRHTGIEFIHKEPLSLNIDGRVITLGHNSTHSIREISQAKTANTYYVSTKEKSKLTSVTRTPYFHYIIDGSINSTWGADSIQLKIEELKNQYPSFNTHAKCSIVNYEFEEFKIEELSTKLASHKPKGGFFLQKEIQRILSQSHQDNDTKFPVILVLTTDLSTSILDRDFKDIEIAFPESPYFFALDDNGKIAAHSLVGNPFIHRPNIMIQDAVKPVLAWPSTINPHAYLNDNNLPSIVLKDIYRPLSNNLSRSWESGLQLHGESIAQKLRTKESKSNWLDLIKGSFQTGIMTPLTSYMVVETEAQKVILLRKKEQVISGSEHLDLGDDTQRMSEPNIWILILIIILFLAYKNRASIHLKGISIRE